MHGNRCGAVECHEIWTFVRKKESTMKADERKANPQLGDQYIYIALDPTTKLIPAFHVGKRDAINTHQFIEDLSRRIDGTDAWGPYSPAITISRYFGRPMCKSPSFTPRRILAQAVMRRESFRNGDYGNSWHPRLQQGCTSYVERQNLTFRMKVARFHRPSLAFSRGPANLRAAGLLCISGRINFV